MGLAAVGIVASADLIVERLSTQHLRPRIERELGEALGVPVSIEGTVGFDLLPELDLRVESLRVANLPGRPSPEMLRVETVDLHIAWRPLLRGALAIDRIEIHGAELRIEPDAVGAWSLPSDPNRFDEPESREGRDPLELRIRNLRVEDAALFYDPVGGDDARTAQLAELDLETRDFDSPVSVAVRGAIDGEDVALQGQLGAVRELLAPTSPFPVDLRARLRDVELAVRGTLTAPRSLEGLALRVEATIADLAALLATRGRDIPALGRVEVSGWLEDPDGVLGVRELSLRTRAPGAVDLVVEGSIADLRSVSGVDLRVDLDAPDAEVFEPLAGFSLPSAPIEADFEISDDDGSLGIEGEAGTEGSFDLDLRGVLDDVRRLQDLNVQVRLDSTTLEAVPEAFGVEPDIPIPALGPLVATGRFTDNDGVFGLRDFDLRAGQDGGIEARIRGRVDDLVARRGIALQIDIDAPSSRELAAFYDLSIPELGALEARASLSDADGSLGLEEVLVEVGTAERVAASLRGAFDDLRELGEVDFAFELQTQSLADLGDLLGAELPPLGPAAFRGTLRGSDERLETRGRATLGNTEFEGDATAGFAPGQRPHLVAELRSGHVHLADLGVSPAGTVPDAQTIPVDPAVWWHSGRPLDVERLHDVDLSLSLAVDRVTGRELLEASDLRVALELDDGLLEIRDVSALYKGGRLAASAQVNARSLDPTLTFALEAFNIDLTRIALQFQENPEYAGLLDLSIDLESAGRLPEDWVRNLDGIAGMMLRNGALVSRYSRAFSVDLLRVSLPGFLVEREQRVRCLLALFSLERGIASAKELYLEGANITVTGAGTVDLPRDALDLRLTPQVHDPGLVSVAATVDVTGPMASPRIRAVRRSLGVSAAQALVHNALRPVRAVRNAVRRGESQALSQLEDPCDAVMLHRVEQMQTATVEEIDLDEVAKRAADSAPEDPPLPEVSSGDAQGGER